MADIIFPGAPPVNTLGANNLPGNIDLSIWKGDAQTYVIKVTSSDGSAFDLAGKTPEATIRTTFEGSPAYDFVCTVQNGNEVKLYLSSTVSGTLPAGDHLWNFQLTDDATGDVRTYLAGDVKVYAEVD